MKDIVKGKRILVTGSSSGIGLETARLLSEQGAEVLGLDINKGFDHVDEFYRADLSDPRTIDALIDVLPEDIDGLVNNAGLPPTQPANRLLLVNWLGLKRLTHGLIPKLTDAASIVNVASLAGHGWPNAVDAIKAAELGAARLACTVRMCMCMAAHAHAHEARLRGARARARARKRTKHAARSIHSCRCHFSNKIVLDDAWSFRQRSIQRSISLAICALVALPEHCIAVIFSKFGM